MGFEVFEENYSQFWFNPDSGVIMHKSTDDLAEGVLEFPNNIEGIPVTVIARAKDRVDPDSTSKIHDIIIPDTIERIMENSFRGYEHLKHVEYEGDPQVAVIESNAFTECFKLQDIYIPDSVGHVEWKAFSSHPEVKSIYIGRNFSEIKSFLNNLYCPAIEKLEVHPENEKYYTQDNCIINKGENPVVQYGCKNSIIPKDPEITEIGADSFRWVRFDKPFHIPGNIKKIGNSAFYLAKGLADTILPRGLEKVEDFSFCDSDIQSIVLGENLDYLGRCAFLRCKNINGLILEDCENLKVISASAFTDCENLKSVIFPPNLKRIYMSAFNSCKKLEKVFLPESCVEIANCAFYGCENLRYVDMGDTQIEKISASLFDGCVNLKEVVLPDSVKTIGSSAFKDCCSMTDIVLPDGIKQIDSLAFSNSGLEGIFRFPDKVQELSVCVLEKCTGLCGVELPKELKYINEFAFKDCEGPFTVHVPKEVGTFSMNFLMNFKSGPVDIFCRGNEHFVEHFQREFKIKDDMKVNFHIAKDAALLMVPCSKGGVPYSYWNAVADKSKHYKFGSMYNVIQDIGEPPRRSVDDEIKAAYDGLESSADDILSAAGKEDIEK